MIEGREFPLGPDGLERENGMLVGGPIEDRGWVDDVLRVQGDEIVLTVGDALQGVHPVVGRRPLVAA